MMSARVWGLVVLFASVVGCGTDAKFEITPRACADYAARVVPVNVFKGGTYSCHAVIDPTFMLPATVHRTGVDLVAPIFEYPKDGVNFAGDTDYFGVYALLDFNPDTNPGQQCEWFDVAKSDCVQP